MTERDALRSRVERAVGALFEIEDEIGRGGMAVVYRARDVRLHRKVALKVLPPELAFREDVKSRFLREAQMAAQLSHPNIVPIYAVDEIDGVVFFAMGLVQGETLAQQLAREPRPPVGTVRDLLAEVAAALAYAHGQQVVHRDVKPDNILIERATGRALVSDFGIARAAEGDMRLTAAGVAVGTPAYMSPEQAMGERAVDGRADIYSLGVVGYQMLAGELPFRAANTPAMLVQHISHAPRPLREVRADLPVNLAHAIERAMSKSRADRWPDAAAFRDALAPAASVDSFHGASAHEIDAGSSRVHGVPGRGDSLPRFPEHLGGRAFDARTRNAIREWKAEQRRWREQKRHHNERDAPESVAGIARLSRRELRRAERAGLVQVPPEERIRSVQRAVFQYASVTGFLFAINMVTDARFPWFIFPALAMGIGVITKVSSLWVDGIPIRRIFQRQSRQHEQSALESPEGVTAHAEARTRRSSRDLAGVSSAVLDGPHGGAIRDAAQARATIEDVLAGLADADKRMLPEILPTVTTVVERIWSLAQALHQLDSDASPEAISDLERRLDAARAPAPGAATRDAERRIELLERQLVTLRDLAARHDAVAQQLESASLVLQTMKLDMLRLRSSGLESTLDTSGGATQEARALSGDIGRVIEANREVRKL